MGDNEGEVHDAGLLTNNNDSACAETDHCGKDDDTLDNQAFLDKDIETNIPTRVGIDSSTTSVSAMFIVANAAIGCGTLAFPEAFNGAGGLAVGLLMVFMCAVLCAISLMICGLTAGMTNSSEFYEIARVLLGKWAEITAQSFLIVSNIGTCILYLIIVGDQLEFVSFRLFGKEFFCGSWFVQREIMITLASFIVIYPLCLIKRVDFLKYPSMLSVFSMVYVMLVVTYKYFTMEGEPPELKYRPDQWTDIFTAFPTILFAYQCMTNSCPVYANLKVKTPKNWTVVVCGCISICTVIYLPTAIFGYLTNGTNVASNILQSYDPNDNMVFVAQCTVLLSVMMTYPVIYFVARNAMDPMYTNLRTNYDKSYDPMEGEAVRRYVTATIWHLLALGSALFIPNITVAIDFAGTVAAFFYLIFPGLYLARVSFMKREEFGPTRANAAFGLGSFMLVIGVGLFVQGFYLSVQGLFKDTVIERLCIDDSLTQALVNATTTAVTGGPNNV